jgi:octaprenyl-diphosphate synthase
LKVQKRAALLALSPGLSAMNPLFQTIRETGRTVISPYAPIAREMAEVERLLAETVRNDHPGVAEVVGHVSHYKGKRLRPALLLLTAKACGRLTPKHPVLAAVIELIHTATLVHDDVLDNASTRRHVATANARWGNHNSVLLGDYLFTHAFYLATTLGDIQACQLIGAATNRVCEGELRQGLERGNLALSEADYFDLIDAKTAELIACSSRLGAIYSGAAPAMVDAMERYGRLIGIAFQIADDLLDIVGEERATGKSLGTDLEQQKMTLPLIRLLNTAPEPRRFVMQQILNAPGNHKREALAPFLAESDAVDYARQTALEYADRARAELACLPQSTSRTILEAAADGVVHRNS